MVYVRVKSSSCNIVLALSYITCQLNDWPLPPKIQEGNEMKKMKEYNFQCSLFSNLQDTSKKSPMELINEVPPIKVEGRIVACEGG